MRSRPIDQPYDAHDTLKRLQHLSVSTVEYGPELAHVVSFRCGLIGQQERTTGVGPSR